MIGLTGCYAQQEGESLAKKFPYLDLILGPDTVEQVAQAVEVAKTDRPVVWTQFDSGKAYSIPIQNDIRPAGSSAYINIIKGCDKFCSFCIIPYRRGREVSRTIADIANEVELLAARNVKEITLLGQNVDSYGHDLPNKSDLADLLNAVNEIDDLKRIRFLTSHPNDMSQHIIDTIDRLPKVMENVNLPFQAGNDQVLGRMKRGYTNAEYREIVGRVRASIPGVAMVTDLIVGFPGETAVQFEDTLAMVRDLRFDKVHTAAYSTRPNTFAQRKMEDDVPHEEKQRRLKAIEEVQTAVLTEINNAYFGTSQEVLVDRRKAGRWQGRTRTDKLVFFDPPDDSGDDLLGQLVSVRITKTTPWSLQGKLLAG